MSKSRELLALMGVMALAAGSSREVRPWTAQPPQPRKASKEERQKRKAVKAELASTQFRNKDAV